MTGNAKIKWKVLHPAINSETDILGYIYFNNGDLCFMKKLTSISLVSALLMFTTIVNAMDISDVKIGDSVFIKNMVIKDEKCEVLNVDNTNGSVLIKKISGSQEWMKADDLTSGFGSVVRDKIKDEVVDATANVIKSIFSSSDSDGK